MEDQALELDNHLNDSTDIVLSASGKKDFISIANWCIFFSVIGFLFSLLMFFAAIAVSTFVGQMGDTIPFGGYIHYVYIVLGLIYLLPIYFLFKFALGVKGGIARTNSLDFNKSINKLKIHFLIMGVMTIASVVIYLIFIIALVGGVTSGMANEWAL